MKPEMIVRRAAHRLGYRFRLHRRDLPGTPDLVFTSRRKVIFVHGCFWHRHADPACKAAHTPRSNGAYWGPKLDRNVERDRAARVALEVEGWQVLELWECGLKDAAVVDDALRRFLGSQGAVTVSPSFPSASAPSP